jgi:hypothetical protein
LSCAQLTFQAAAALARSGYLSQAEKRFLEIADHCVAEHNGRRLRFRRMRFAAPTVILCALITAPGIARGEVTASQVKEAIEKGAAYLEKQQRPEGRWSEYESEPGGVTALCTLALLSAGRTPEDDSVRRALAWMEALREPEGTYSSALTIMTYAKADSEKYFERIRRLATALARRQLREDAVNKGGWSYRGPTRGSADNSNTHFAMMALDEAERAGVKDIKDETWRLALRYWTQPGMQSPTGGFGYGVNRDNQASGSMTCAAIDSLLMARDRLSVADAMVIDGRVECCGAQAADGAVDNAMQWLGDKFSVARNPNHPSGNWLLYYLHALQRVCRMSGERYLLTTRRALGTGPKLDIPVVRDWYREGCESLLKFQDKYNPSFRGIGPVEGMPEIGTAFALLFLSEGRRGVVMAKLQHKPDDGGKSADWDHHRRAVRNLTSRVERQWHRDLSWQTIDFTRRSIREGSGVREAIQVTAADLLEVPVLFLSGSQALDFSAEQRGVLKQYLENGGFLFVEACSGNGFSSEPFDRSFRVLMRELFPATELRKLPPDHAIWYAQERIDPGQLPKDSDFGLWGLDVCCRTSVVYCPRSLSCYWELDHPYRKAEYPQAIKDQIDQVGRIGSNVLAYAAGRELKEKLDRPLFPAVNPRAGPPPNSIVVPTLDVGHGDEAPGALNQLLQVVAWRYQMPVDFDRRLIVSGAPNSADCPIAFVHGRRAFELSAQQRQSLKTYLDDGGFVFAAAICASEDFANCLRSELKQMYPASSFVRLEADHPVIDQPRPGFRLSEVTLREPQPYIEGRPLTTKLISAPPVLEGLIVDERLVAVLSPYDISCALARGPSLEYKSYVAVDAAALGANVLLYALQRKYGRLR